MLASVLQPGRQVVECLSAGDVVHEQRSCSTTIIGPRDGSERLLTRRVPNLQLNLWNKGTFWLEGDAMLWK